MNIMKTKCVIVLCSNFKTCLYFVDHKMKELNKTRRIDMCMKEIEILSYNWQNLSKNS